MLNLRAPLKLAAVLPLLCACLACAEPAQVIIQARIIAARNGEPEVLSAPRVTVQEDQEAAIRVVQEHALALPDPKLAKYVQILSDGVSMRVCPSIVEGRVLLKGTATTASPVDGPASFHRAQDQVSRSVNKVETAFVLRLEPGETKTVPAGEDTTIEISAELVSLANAATVYWQAFAVLPPYPEGDDPEALADWIVQSEPALGHLHKAGDMSFCNWELDYSQGFSLALPHLSEMNTLAKAALVRAKATLQSDPALAHADLRAVMRAARHAGADALLIAQLVRIRMENQVREVLAAGLADIPDRELDAWRALLSSQPAMPTLAQLLDTERQLAVDYLRSKLAEADEATKAKMLRELGIDTPVPAARLDEMIDAADADYRELVHIADLPPAERTPAMAAFQKALAARKNALARVLVPAVGKAAEKLQQSEAEAQDLRKQLDGLRRRRETQTRRHGK